MLGHFTGNSKDKTRLIAGKSLELDSTKFMR